MPFTITIFRVKKANQENPQIFLICKYINDFSAEYTQSNAEGI